MKSFPNCDGDTRYLFPVYAATTSIAAISTILKIIFFFSFLFFSFAPPCSKDWFWNWQKVSFDDYKKKNGLLGNVWKGFIWKFNKNLDSTGRGGWKRICFNDIHSRLVKFQIWPSIISYLFSLKTLTLRSHISVEKKIPKFFQIEAI